MTTYDNLQKLNFGFCFGSTFQKIQPKVAVACT